jgi:sec-independent protein translocase protein TatB
MEILGIGPSELVFIVVIALIILGPTEMQKAGRTLGRWLRQVVTSDGWKLFQQTSREIQTLPNRLMRDAALDELKNVQRDLKDFSEGERHPGEAGAADVGPRHQADPAAAAAEPKILPTPHETGTTPKNHGSDA